MATREVCNLRRIRTNTPLQSFMTLNDAAFIEAAQSMARTMAKHSADPKAQIAHGVKSALLRPASSAQIDTLAGLYQDMIKDYSASEKDAKTFAGKQPIPENSNPVKIAALTVVANVILNQDAFLTK